jgi:hypothetical protein
VATGETGKSPSREKTVNVKPEFSIELKKTARRLAMQDRWDEARSLYYYVVELSERLFGATSPESKAARQMFEPLYSTQSAKD